MILTYKYVIHVLMMVYLNQTSVCYLFYFFYYLVVVGLNPH
jgi:hypothetical protein